MASTKTKRRTPQELLKRERVSADRLKIRLEKAQMKVALSYYAAADRGRRNKDWKSPVVSADQAIIPDVVVTAARARTTVANTWVGKAAVRSQKRNVVGRGIMVVPTAKDRKGKELAEVNRDAGEKFIRWASSRLACDLEKKRSFWQYQRCIVGEEFITGIGLLVWSYRPNPNNVGLRLQMLELEQLNMSIRSYQKNEVRSGVEIDEDGAAVAYHFYRKTPNDYLGTGLEPLRVPAFNVFPYFDAERVRQTVGISQLAPVLQDVRDFSRIKDSTLSRAYMESCIGFAIKQNGGTLGTSPLAMQRQAGDTGATDSGMPTIDFTPGMVPHLQPGEDITPLMPTTPGNTYEPFSKMTLRGIGAGAGMSYGALTRQNEANYSAARQDMLEDEREIGPSQDSLVDHIVMPIYELWFRLAVLEGRLPDVNEEEFISDPDRFIDADYVFPARPWIDPEKEVNAYEKAINLRIKSRSEIIAQDGGSFKSMMKRIAQDRDEAKTEGITFPEDQPAPQKALPAPPPKEPDQVSLAAVSDVPPDYRPSTAPTKQCGSCVFYKSGNCTAYNGVAVGDWMICDAYEPVPSKAGRVVMSPGIPEGEKGIDRDFAPAARPAR